MLIFVTVCKIFFVIAPCPSHCGLGEQCLLKKHKDGSLISECACKASSEKCGGCKDEGKVTLPGQ